MKAKVVIENGETTIVLTPENEFEIDVMDKAYSRKENFELKTTVDAEYSYGQFSKHKIFISIKKLDKTPKQC